jgi:hypothetical protein
LFGLSGVEVARGVEVAKMSTKKRKSRVSDSDSSSDSGSDSDSDSGSDSDGSSSTSDSSSDSDDGRRSKKRKSSKKKKKKKDSKKQKKKKKDKKKKDKKAKRKKRKRKEEKQLDALLSNQGGPDENRNELKDQVQGTKPPEAEVDAYAFSIEQGKVAKGMLKDPEYRAFRKSNSQRKAAPGAYEDFGDLMQRRKTQKLHRELNKAAKMGDKADKADKIEKDKMRKLLQSVGIELPDDLKTGETQAAEAQPKADAPVVACVTCGPFLACRCRR